MKGTAQCLLSVLPAPQQPRLKNRQPNVVGIDGDIRVRWWRPRSSHVYPTFICYALPSLTYKPEGFFKKTDALVELSELGFYDIEGRNRFALPMIRKAA